LEFFWVGVSGLGGVFGRSGLGGGGSRGFGWWLGPGRGGGEVLVGVRLDFVRSVVDFFPGAFGPLLGAGGRFAVGGVAGWVCGLGWGAWVGG